MVGTNELGGEYVVGNNDCQKIYLMPCCCGHCIFLEQTCWSIRCPGATYCRVGDGLYIHSTLPCCTITATSPEVVYGGCFCQKDENARFVPTRGPRTLDAPLAVNVMTRS